MTVDHKPLNLKSTFLEVTKQLMNTKLTSALLTLVCLIGGAVVANAQGSVATPKAIAFSTAPKLNIAKLKSGDQDAYEVRGKVTYTVTAANSDDTVAGTLTYSLPDDARQKIAAMSGKQVAQVPANFTRKDVIAQFQKATAAPVIHLEIMPMDVEVAGVKMAFNRIVLDVNGRDAGNVPQYTNEEMEALFTVWARQINAGRSRRGIIARMNKVINGEPEQ
jgi:hypothetical protein